MEKELKHRHSVKKKVKRPASVSKDDWYGNNTRIGRVDHESDFGYVVVLPLLD